MHKVRLIVCDGNEMTRALLNSLFDDSPTIEVVGESADHATAMALVRELLPDAVLIGYDLPAQEEFELRSLLRAEMSKTQILKLSDLDESVSSKLRPQIRLQYKQSVLVH